MDRKKILWLVSWYPDKKDPFNGDFIQRHANAAALYNDIHVIHVEPDEEGIITGSVKEEVTRRDGLTEQIIYFKKSTSFPGRVRALFKWMKLFKAAIKTYLKENGRPALIHVHVPMKAGQLAVWAKKKYGIPFVVTEHWAIYNQSAENAFFKRKKWFRQLTKYIIAKSDNLLPVSNDLGDSINKWVAKKKFEVIPNVVDTSFFYFKHEEEKERFRFIHVSTMTAFQKRPKDLVDAFIAARKKAENAELFMIGHYSEALYHYAAGTGQINKSIFFTGEITYSEVAIQLQQANAFVLCSLYENQPCAILEALCCGLPVISTRVGGIAEVIDTTNGVLVEPGNTVRLSEAMENLIKNYTFYDRQKITVEAASKFNYHVVGKLFDRAYRQY